MRRGDEVVVTAAKVVAGAKKGPENQLPFRRLRLDRRLDYEPARNLRAAPRLTSPSATSATVLGSGTSTGSA